MMKKGCLLLCATALSLACLDNQVQASINFNLKAPPVPSYAKLHTSHTSHLIARHLSSPSFSERQEIKVAQVCWITDTEDCGGADFVGTDGTQGTPDIIPPGGGGGDDSCIKMGYDKTSCPENYTPSKFCPLDNKYFAECLSDCPDGCKACDEHYTGVGEECCPGKYMECTCDTCDGYDYFENDIPSGYIKGEACESCDGWKYKIIPNSCIGFLDCNGDCAIGSDTCLAGDKTLCKDCPPCPNACTLIECPENAICDKENCSGLYCRTGCANGYSWDETSQSCIAACQNKCTLNSCPANAICDKEDCSGKYCRTGCKSGYEWNSSSQSCQKACANKGTLASCPWPFTCTFEECSGKYYKSGCQSGYDWDSYTQTCTEEKCANKGTLTSCPWPFTCTFEECSGKYYKSGCQSGYGYSWDSYNKTCICSSSYKYTCTGSNQIGGIGTACEGKYTKCECSGVSSWDNGTCSCPLTYKYSCTGIGYAGGDGIACDDKYAKCICETNYIWKNSKCVPCYTPLYEEADGNCEVYYSTYILNYTRTLVYSNGSSLYRKNCAEIRSEHPTKESCEQKLNNLLQQDKCPSASYQTLCL